MWEEMERSPALAAPGSNNFGGLIASTTNASIGSKQRKVQALSEEDANDLCKRYRPLALKIASGYRDRGIDSDDLRAAGLTGLVLASRKFDPQQDVPFGGYAQFWIRGEIRELFKPKADALGFGRAVSLNVPANSEDSGDREVEEKLDSLIDEQTPAANIDVSNLNERERRVFVARIEGETLDTLGSELGVSRERVRQIGARATEKVRTTKGNVARTCIRDLLGRRGYQKPSRRLLPEREVSYAGRTCSPEEIAALVASHPDLEDGR